MPSDLARHREFHNAVLAYHCDVEGCNFSARSMQTVKRHQKVEHQVRTTVKLHFRDSWLNWTPHYYGQFMDIITDPPKILANCSPYFTALQHINNLETKRSYKRKVNLKNLKF